MSDQINHLLILVFFSQRKWQCDAMRWPFFFSYQPLMTWSLPPPPPPSFNSLFIIVTAVFALSQRAKDRNSLNAAMLTRSLHSSVCELADNVQGSPTSGRWERPCKPTWPLIGYRCVFKCDRFIFCAWQWTAKWITVQKAWGFLCSTLVLFGALNSQMLSRITLCLIAFTRSDGA